MRFFAVGLALLAMTPAQAQEPNIAAQAQFSLRVAKLRDVLSEAMQLTPKVDVFARDGGDAAELERVIAKARESVPQVKALLAEVETLPALSRIGDAAKERGITSFQYSVREVLEELVGGLETTVSPPDATLRAALQVVDASGVEMDVVRGSSLAIGRNCSLDFEASTAHAVCGMFAEINTVRGILLSVKTDAPPVKAQRDKLSTSVSRLEALQAEAGQAMSPTFAHELGVLIAILKHGVAALEATRVEETTMLALLMQLSERTRGMLEGQGS